MDNLCAFRCLAYHKKGDRFQEQEVKRLYRQWLAFTKHSETFQGINLDELPEWEECFNINIMVYSLLEEKKAVSIYRSMKLYSDTMYLNLYDRHFSYISNIESYCKRFKCSFCGQLFSKASAQQQHYSTCTSKTKFRFPGGYYTTKTSIFDEAENIGIPVPLSERFNP